MQAENMFKNFGRLIALLAPTHSKKLESKARDMGRRQNPVVEPSGNVSKALTDRHVSQAKKFAKTHDWHKALKEWSTAKSLASEQANVSNRIYIGESRALRALARSHLARPKIEEAIEMKGRHATLLNEYASVLADLGENGRAIDLMIEVVGASPTSERFAQLISLYADEGMHERAHSTLSAAIPRYPQDPILREAEIALRLKFGDIGSDATLLDSLSATDYLFLDKRVSQSMPEVALTIGSENENIYVQRILNANRCIAPFSEKDDPNSVTAFAVWGATKSGRHDLLRMYAEKLKKPLLTLEYGFVSSLDIALNKAAQHSLIVNPGPIYFDSTQPTAAEKDLNDPAFSLTRDQIRRAENCIALLRDTKVTKYNHAPVLDMEVRLGEKIRPRILLVDQRFGDKSISMGLASASSFKAMFDCALAMKDHDILVKMHPDAISGGKGSYLKELVDSCDDPRITVIDYEVNPFSLFDVVDKVFVVVSQLGFEAAFSQKEVWCFGVAFYSGWGVTVDKVPVPRRRVPRTVAEVFHVFYLRYSRYWVPDSANHELEDLIDYVVANRAVITAPVNLPVSPSSVAKKILFIVPSGRAGASGRYMQTLGESLTSLGYSVTILAEGKGYPIRNGVRWRTLDFDGSKLTHALRQRLVEFSPDIIYMNGVRTRAQRAALEIMYLTGARLAVQSEDDDVDVYKHRRPSGRISHLTELDKEHVTYEEAAKFLSNLDWSSTLNVLFDPAYDRWIDPLLRIIINRAAELHTAIWYPFAERLRAEYGKPTLVVPPVASAGDFSRPMLTHSERCDVLRRYEIDPDKIVFFLGGSIYEYSDGFQLFLKAINHLARFAPGKIALIIAGKSTVDVDSLLNDTLDPEIQRIYLQRPSDAVFMELTKASDVCCSPGGDNRFELYRLPSRLVKAMAMGKPIVVGSCGFGATLQHGLNAVIIDGNDPLAWADRMASLLNSETRERIGRGARDFALIHFEPSVVASRLSDAFQNMRSGTQGNFLNITVSGKSRKTDIPLEIDAPLYKPLASLFGNGMDDVSDVLHIGPSCLASLSDYIRMAPRRVGLKGGIQTEMAEVGGSNKDIEVIAADTHPIDSVREWAAGSRALLVCELNGECETISYSDLIAAASKFRWIILSITGTTSVNPAEIARMIADGNTQAEVIDIPADGNKVFVIASRSF
ncbi:capsular polysaccharide export protein, LipB/KpsS family [Aliirhizobium smilacinae]|uniref:capsular polysaccharide export protein, LipB/KpsS family n=1 Tax=Aliirhizobium smilacinae TaxID=1395944 RepID=UPI0015D62B1B|nr:glycosyltransferase [Rhizobium smilacinae]